MIDSALFVLAAIGRSDNKIKKISTELEKEKEAQFLKISSVDEFSTVSNEAPEMLKITDDSRSFFAIHQLRHTTSLRVREKERKDQSKGPYGILIFAPHKRQDN